MMRINISNAQIAEHRTRLDDLFCEDVREMKEKILAVLVVVALIISTISLVLSPRTGLQGPKGNTGDTGPQGLQGPQGPSSNIDADTIRADSFELKIKDYFGVYGSPINLEFVRIDNGTLFNNDISQITNVTLFSATAFYNYIVAENSDQTIIRFQNSFYIIKWTLPAFILYCTP